MTDDQMKQQIIAAIQTDATLITLLRGAATNAINAMGTDQLTMIMNRLGLSTATTPPSN